MLNDITSFLFAWYNLPFTILLVACIVLAAMQLMGLSGEQDTEGEAELDHDVDVDHEVELDHDTDLDHDADFSHEVDHDVAQEASLEGEPNVFNMLAFIGLGKAPLLVVLLILFGSIGLLGWILNTMVKNIFGVYPGVAFAAVLPIAVLAGMLISSRSAHFIGRALPPISTTATRAQALVGRRGTVISPYVDEKYGMVHLRDEGSTLINVFAVIQGGEPIKRNSEVALVSYDPVKKVYTVASVS